MGFSYDEDDIINYYDSEQAAFEDACDTLITDPAFAYLYAEEQDDFFEFAYENWADYLNAEGYIEWHELFQAWREDI